MAVEQPIFKQLAERNIFNLIHAPENLHYRMVVATDMEGPLVLGDTIAKVMSLKLYPHGEHIFESMYDAYNGWTESRRRSPENKRPGGQAPLWAQEGTDVAFMLPLFLATNTNEGFINRIAMEYRRTPGSEALIKYYKENGALVIGVTTSYENPNKLIADKIGLDGLIGTPFPLDLAKKILVESGKYEEEINSTRLFLSDCHAIIINGHNKILLSERIRHFYEDELGVSYDPEIRSNPNRHRTVLGKMIEEIGVVGDRGKAAVARALFHSKSTPSGLTIAIGDGTNDGAMLELSQATLSIAINGGPIKNAKIGVITTDVSTLIPLIEIIKNNLSISTDDLIAQAQIAVGNKAIIHKGGHDVSQELIDKHAAMKKLLRGEIGTVTP